MAKRSTATKIKTETKAPTAAQVQAHVLEIFAYHCGCIMTEANLNGFGLNVPGGPEVYVIMKIVARTTDGNTAWDQVEVNGVHLGNRCAARDEYARLCAPVIAAAFAVK